jgi:hypothetical protein
VEYDLSVGFDPALNIEDVGVLSPAPNNNGELLEAGLTVSGEIAPVTIHCRADAGKREVFLKSNGEEISNLHVDEDYNLWPEGGSRFWTGKKCNVYSLARFTNGRENATSFGLWF